MNTYQELIESIRESRNRMSEACDHNSKKYIDYLKTFNATYSKQVALFQKLQNEAPTESPKKISK